ncbi:DUF6542 domain-containing protein [Streptomyces sp. NPDC014864]|uniref:DUF6542 domain-containing protein n=1 Tax=Streptomyces sp. NPDC014864 TaxID=3364924 RepID=UPI0036F51DB1
MEHHRMRPQQHGPRRGRPPLPSQGAQGHREQAAGGRPARPGPRASPRPGARPPGAAPLRRLPEPRLTGLGGGLFCVTVMVALGWLVRLILGGSLTAYGVLFLPVCVLTAAWVRRGDLLTSPVVVPIGFAVGLLPVAEGDGLGGRIMGLVTALATQAGWLYGGTLIAGVIALVRRVALVRARRRAHVPL